MIWRRVGDSTDTVVTVSKNLNPHTLVFLGRSKTLWIYIDTDRHQRKTILVKFFKKFQLKELFFNVN